MCISSGGVVAILGMAEHYNINVLKTASIVEEYVIACPKLHCYDLSSRHSDYLAIFKAEPTNLVCKAVKRVMQYLVNILMIPNYTRNSDV